MPIFRATVWFLDNDDTSYMIRRIAQEEAPNEMEFKCIVMDKLLNDKLYTNQTVAFGPITKKE